MANKKKVFDVIPPKEAEVTPVKKPIRRSKPRRFIPKAPILSVGVLLLIIVLSYVFIEDKATLEIWPVKSQVQFERQVIIDVSQNTTTSISGEVVIKEQSASAKFPSTGSKLKSIKASGIIRIYNAYSTLSQILIATTRFVSDDGKLFRTPKRVIIPGGHYEGGKLVPGEIDITVEAGEAGEEYNIGPSTFSIPGFAGTPRYTAFYAKSFEPMAGGMKQEVAQVSQEDLNKAQESLEERALTNCQTALEEFTSSQNYILVEEAITGQIIQITPLAEKGQEVDSFVFQVKAEIKALVFKKQNLEDFAKNYILSQIPQEKELVAGALTIGYSVKDVDLGEGRMILDIEMTSEIYSAIDEVSLKEAVKNKKPDEIKSVLRNFPEIDKVGVRLWPFWVNKSPEDTERIKISLILD